MVAPNQKKKKNPSSNKQNTAKSSTDRTSSKKQNFAKSSSDSKKNSRVASSSSTFDMAIVKVEKSNSKTR